MTDDEVRCATRPLTPKQMDCLIIFIHTWITAKFDPRTVSYLEAKTVREELLEAFGITEDEMDEVRKSPPV